MNHKNNLTEGPLFSAMIAFTIPFLFSSLLQTMYGTTDTLVIGNFGSTAGVSAVATGAHALSLVTFFSMGLCSGSTVLLGRAIGAKNDKYAASIVGNTIIDFGALSVVFMAAALLGYRLILRLLNIPPEALSEAYRYMIICSIGVPMIIGYNTVGAVLRAMGDSKSPLLFVGIACAVNIAGDLLLTGVFHMGAAGVAIATVLAQGISFVFSLMFLMKKGLPFAFSRKDIRFNKETSLQMLKVGLPIGIQSIMINLSFLFITSIINSMGVSASAAMGIGDKITGFAFMPQHSFSASLAVIVSQNMGAGQPERSRKALKYALLICIVIEALFFAVCLVFPAFFPSLFSKDPQVIKMTGDYMKAYGADAVLTAMAFCMGGFVNGCGKTTFNMAQNLIGTFLVRIPATWVFSRLPNANLFLIGLAAPLCTVINVTLLAWYIGRMKRKGELN
ncbi:MAG: MATE family efflux transporter [Oscillospiraceae bacterium]|nr:MATE family efflux transporter [Oscillospiraceae bacterium]